MDEREARRDEQRVLKLLHCTVQYQYVDEVDDILVEHEVGDYVRHPMVQGRDADGRHRGDKVFPGNIAEFWALVPANRMPRLLEALRAFRDSSRAHAHLRAAVVSLDQVL